MLTRPVEDNMEQQLQMLYAEREQLHREIGVSDTHEVVTMVRSLEDQLRTFYREQSESLSGSAGKILSCIKELSSQLDPHYSERSVTVEVDNDRPVVRATWREQI